MKHIIDRSLTLYFVLRGLLGDYGWLRSWWCGRPVDAKDNPLPWISYPAIDFLSQFDFSNASVFEWGSGFSTLWWAKRCRRIATVESNPEWIPYIRGLLPESVELLVTPLEVEAETRALTQHHTSQHDVIVIDNHGPFRRHCAGVAADGLADGGLIILDNSDQCLIACEVLRRRGLSSTLLVLRQVTATRNVRASSSASI